MLQHVAMIIGVDFDNTIPTAHDRLFHRLAMERDLIPGALPAAEEVIRATLQDTGPGRHLDGTAAVGLRPADW